MAIIHDWLTGMRVGEKCLEVFCELFPGAELFTILHKKGSVSSAIENMRIHTSFIQNLPFAQARYRMFLPLFPAAVESFDLRKFNLILSSSHCAAKGIKKPQGALHICYCYTPARYAWGLFDEYFSMGNPIKKFFISFGINRFKSWDFRVNKRVDYFVAISHNVKNRVRKYYGRNADVIYPPVEAASCALPARNLGDYYLLVSALVPYKRVDIAVKAFNESGRRLVVVGTGPEEAALKARSAKNVTLEGWVDSERLGSLYAGCQALIFPGEEDFGIVPVEAASYGKSVIAYGRGGALETVKPFDKTLVEENPTGVFFYDKTASSLNDAVGLFEKNRSAFRPIAARANAERFNRERFRREMQVYIEEKWKIHTLSKYEDTKRR